MTEYGESPYPAFSLKWARRKAGDIVAGREVTPEQEAMSRAWRKGVGKKQYKKLTDKEEMEHRAVKSKPKNKKDPFIPLQVIIDQENQSTNKSKYKQGGGKIMYGYKKGGKV